MKTLEIRTLILFLLVCTSHAIFSQGDAKFKLTLEYSPNYSKVTSGFERIGSKVSHNALLRINYIANGKVEPTVGIGFMNTGDLTTSEPGGQLGFESIRIVNSYNYLYVPIGVKFNFGNLYLLPELGIGLNIFNRTKTEATFINGETELRIADLQATSGEVNQWSVPISLSFGFDFVLGTRSFSTGVKGYYSLNQLVNEGLRNHYHGIGLILATRL